ncbi:hypothetical protein Dfri01_59700 [Dyadobacter frigoris]|nr:hypothetical protein Dfri01_59700 [Dyadobacter frigoris]
MKKKSLYDSYLRVQLEAIIITVLAITLTIGCLAWCQKFYAEKTSVFYVHNRGVTIQVFDDSKTKKEVVITNIKKVKK